MCTADRTCCLTSWLKKRERRWKSGTNTLGWQDEVEGRRKWQKGATVGETEEGREGVAGERNYKQWHQEWWREKRSRERKRDVPAPAVTPLTSCYLFVPRLTGMCVLYSVSARAESLFFTSWVSLRADRGHQWGGEASQDACPVAALLLFRQCWAWRPLPECWASEATFLPGCLSVSVISSTWRQEENSQKWVFFLSFFSVYLEPLQSKLGLLLIISTVSVWPSTKQQTDLAEICFQVETVGIYQHWHKAYCPSMNCMWHGRSANVTMW